jgi:hypothetical protein
MHVDRGSTTVTHAARFAALFVGNPHYFIACNTKRTKDKQNTTQKRAYTIADVEQHLAGGLGVGISPLMPDSTCTWAAIDIDRPDDADEVDFVKIAKKIKQHSLPVVMCRTRSGGAHLYAFFTRAVPAKLARVTLHKWVDKLKPIEVDLVTPSADYQTVEQDGTLHVSRSMNLPYWKADDTNRYAFAADGKTKLTVVQFLDVAEAARHDPGLYMDIPTDEHAGAPPCVVRMLADGVPAGLRNEGVTQIAIYLKRVDSKDILPRLAAINAKSVEPPLQMDELRKIAKSVGSANKDYRYKCRTEPCKSLCDSKVCLTRAHGIKPNEDETFIEGLPPIESVVRVQKTMEEGGIYQVRINGHVMYAPYDKLVSVRGAQQLFMENMGVILPAKLSHGVWYDFIAPRIATARIEDTAPEDSDHGRLDALLNGFIVGRLKEQDSDIMQNRARLETAPIREGDEVVVRLSTLERYCKDKRLAIPNIGNAAVLMRVLGWQNKRMRTPQGVVPVWYKHYSPEAHDDHFDEIEKKDANSDY